MARQTTKTALKETKEQFPTEMMDQLAGNDGLEEADSDSFAIPFLKILQKMSPELEEDHPAFIEGAKAGQLMITGDEEIFDPGSLPVIPVHFRRVFLEWKLREDGGGFVAEYSVDEGSEMIATAERDDKNRDILPNGHEIQDTRVHYLLALTEDGPVPVVFSNARTQIKGSKEWLNKINKRKLPNGEQAKSFAQVYTIETTKRTNERGTWHVFKAVPAGLILDREDPQSLLEAALSFRKMILGGEVEVRFDDLASEDEKEQGQQF